MSEILRSKRLAALTAIVALGALAAGCGSSKSKTSTESAKPAGTTTEHVVGNPATTTTATQIDIHKNLCDTAVDALVKSQFTYTDYTCENTYTVGSGGAQWGFSISPTEAAHATVEETAYDSTAQAQASFNASVQVDGGGTPAGTIDGMQCLWLPSLKTSDTTTPETSSINCLGGTTEVDFLQQNPTASLDYSKKVMQLVLQTASQ